MLAPLELPRTARVLELACGKGVTAVRLAREFGFSVLAIDGFAPFIESAASRAKKSGVANRCEFRCADLRKPLSDSGHFDLVLMLGIGPVLGDQAATAGALRKSVRPGGYMLIDDAYLLPGVKPIGPLETYVAAQERETERMPRTMVFALWLLRRAV